MRLIYRARLWKRGGAVSTNELQSHDPNVSTSVYWHHTAIIRQLLGSCCLQRIPPPQRRRPWLHGRVYRPAANRGFLGVSIEAQRAWHGILPDFLSNQMAASHCGAVHRGIPVRDFEPAILLTCRW
jgi:hypothetical protein